MPPLRVYGTPESRAQQTQFWAQYYPQQQRANAEFGLRAWQAQQNEEAQQQALNDAAAARAANNEYNRLALFATENVRNRAADESLRRFNADLGFSREVEAEKKRRFEIEMPIRKAALSANLAHAELKKTAALQNDILGGKFKSLDEIESLGVVNPSNAANVLKWFNQAGADRLQEQLETLNAETAKFQAKRFGKKQPVNIDAQTASLIARSLSDKIGPLPSTVRWDSIAGKWTTRPAQVVSPVTERINLSRYSNPTGVLPDTVSMLPVANTANDLVAVFNPAGQPVKIRRSQLTEALSKGYRLR